MSSFRALAPLAILSYALGAGVTTGATAVAAGCSPAANRQAAHTALDVTKVACIIANAEAPDATVTQICDVVDALIPDMRRILGQTREGNRRRYAAARMAASRCEDAGAR